MIRTIITAALAAGFISSTAAATELGDDATGTTEVDVFAAEESAGVHTHDGFFLRFVAGSVAMGVGRDDVGNDGGGIVSVGGTFQASIGGTVAENLALHLDFLSCDGEATWSELADERVYSRNENVSLTGVGMGITRYFPVTNVYLSGSIMPVWIHTPALDPESTEIDLAYGGMLQLKAGKEWWVSDNWGLGIVGTVFGGAAATNGDDTTTLGFGGVTLGLSATYN